jgi:hypothetical protein
MRITFVIAMIATLGALMITGCAKKESSPDHVGWSAPPGTPPIVVEMIAAHGGMDAWKAAPTVSFEDEFIGGGGPPSVSRVVVEQGRRRAYIEYPAKGATAAWDGDSCWSRNWREPFPPRFLIHLNYYFLNIPWLTMDPGVKLVEQGMGTLGTDSTEYARFMMTFMPGTGDTPRDYYRLHIDPVTKRLKGYQYVATYSAILPKGMQSSPENTLIFDSLATVSGLVVPVKYTIYGPDQKPIASCAIRDWSFIRPFEGSRLAEPADAVMDRSTP